MKTASELIHDYALEHIECHAGHIAYEAGRLDIAVKDLTRHYQFKTRAETMLDAGEAACLQALDSIRKARKAYQKLEAA